MLLQEAIMPATFLAMTPSRTQGFINTLALLLNWKINSQFSTARILFSLQSIDKDSRFDKRNTECVDVLILIKASILRTIHLKLHLSI
jgi:hypothetical protein